MAEKFTKIDIITSQGKFEELKNALGDIGITGMTVTNVLGCGMQKGHKEYYRGVTMDINLLPKVKVEVVVCEIPVETVVETAKKILYSGNMGDGKIFIYNVENIIRISSGDEGKAALQYKKES
ncbi:P-II family nitrogen regulator [Clostridium tyrobutyricum]|jgi:nitrogen regulatory protein P-II 1|uniref:Nitrogen regulatory protein P-II n=1 Tax=Clostridium tyrobutyricum DIVETGP TaxID=1408889 RepID=W6N363_CLOTY|nr:P-II family nitrogen regulator [Clostridium tyrobutyricum]AND83978.1 nitrogen regulatory protein PII [Clostridium tyrobutyricum]ANP68716.1 nitrogen regulatory PII [Clostridium tyrobutyricum]MBR9647134.1 P-II family nitrogen regulator [Clostridium tyrobutyricum]MBV4415657.1 P-II family nitrogen regulator [Clostridium tyrobutyricum]MBV4419177.1 P-II family nitrogen regulator [Clostridium tyrobutyricum]